MAKQSACNAMQCNALDILEKQQYLAVPGSTTNTLLEKLNSVAEHAEASPHPLVAESRVHRPAHAAQ